MNIGTMIPSANGDQTNNQVIEKYCYNNDPNYCTTYGGLYQWAEAVQYQNGAGISTSPNPAFTGNVRGLCPAGWHLPSDTEWTTLENALGGSSVAGTALKSVNNVNGNNSSGFNALLGGLRFTSGTFGTMGADTYFWSSSESSSTAAVNRYLYYLNSNIYRGSYGKNYGFSARCTQD